MTHSERLIAAAAEEAPWGPIHIAATERGLAALELMTTREAFEAGLERRYGTPVRWVDGAVPDGGARRKPRAC